MTRQSGGLRAKTQAFGGFLTAMVIPNMGAFIAWGFITALFIPKGWIPNKDFATIVDPMVHDLLPLLLAYTGGNIIHGQRGGVAGAIGTFGLIVGAHIPMFLGAMLMGPASAWIVKKWDEFIQPRIRPGFEMIVNNFGLGIIGFALTLAAYKFVGPGVSALNRALTWAVDQLISTGFTPILSVLNEPAKVLFLNNVIDQGIYYPLGMQQAAEHGKSIFFMVASNPGPGLGLLLAYWFFSGSKVMRQTAPGAIIVHFFGGIHEIYFPYVLSKPLTLLGMIAGAASGIATAQLFGAGLTAGPSPGSIISYMLLTPSSAFVGVIADVLVATLVSFLVNALILRASARRDAAKDEAEMQAELAEAQARSAAMKQEGKDILAGAVGGAGATSAATSRPDPGAGAAPVVGSSTATVSGTGSAGTATATHPVRTVVYACDAGMGSSAMGASVLRRKVEQAGLPVTVSHAAIEKIPADADVVVTHENLVDRLRKAKGEDLEVVPITNFLADPRIDRLLDRLKSENGA